MAFQPRATGVDTLAAASAISFIVVLGLSAYWDPTIRVLHVFEAVPYALAAVLCLRRKKLGYLLGMASGGFWLATASILTSFVGNGFERVAMLMTTGRVDRWDQFIAAPAAVSTGTLMLCSLWGYSRLRTKSPRDLAALLGVLAAVIGFFLLLFRLFAPRYLALFQRLLE